MPQRAALKSVSSPKPLDPPGAKPNRTDTKENLDVDGAETYTFQGKSLSQRVQHVNRDRKRLEPPTRTMTIVTLIK